MRKSKEMKEESSLKRGIEKRVRGKRKLEEMRRK
jgi:hypothetical protein